MLQKLLAAFFATVVLAFSPAGAATITVGNAPAGATELGPFNGSAIAFSTGNEVDFGAVLVQAPFPAGVGTLCSNATAVCTGDIALGSRGPGTAVYRFTLDDATTGFGFVFDNLAAGSFTSLEVIVDGFSLVQSIGLGVTSLLISDVDLSAGESFDLRVSFATSGATNVGARISSLFTFESASPVPIPGALPLMIAGLAGFGFAARRKAQQAA